jgi:outer membrane protein assembly factor BamB
MANRAHKASRLLLGLLASSALLLTSACGSYFGETEEDPPLPGERIAIFELESGLQADSSAAQVPVQLPPAENNASWSQAGGNTEHALGHLVLSSSPSRAWTADVGQGRDDGARIIAQPVVADGKVFTLDAVSTVSAFNASTGSRIWELDLAPEEEDEGFFGGGVAYADGRVYVTTGFAQVAAIDANSGEIVWRRSLPTPMRAAPTVAGGQVYVVTMNSQTFALSAADGSQTWSHRGIQESAALVGAASPAVEGQLVIAPYSSGEVYALRADNGRVLWSDSLSSIRRTDPIADLAGIRGQPVMSGGLTIVMSNAGRTIAIATRQGQRAWDIEAGGINTPWVAGNMVYLLTNEQSVVAVLEGDGRVRWVTQLERYEDPEDREDPITWYGPVLAGNRLIAVSSHGEAALLSPETGEVQSILDLPGNAAVAPVVANGTLYILTQDGTLAAYR